MSDKDTSRERLFKFLLVRNVRLFTEINTYQFSLCSRPTWRQLALFRGSLLDLLFEWVASYNCSVLLSSFTPYDLNFLTLS